MTVNTFIMFRNISNLKYKRILKKLYIHKNIKQQHCVVLFYSNKCLHFLMQPDVSWQTYQKALCWLACMTMRNANFPLEFKLYKLCGRRDWGEHRVSMANVSPISRFHFAKICSNLHLFASLHLNKIFKFIFGVHVYLSSWWKCSFLLAEWITYLNRN